MDTIRLENDLTNIMEVCKKLTSIIRLFDSTAKVKYNNCQLVYKNKELMLFTYADNEADCVRVVVVIDKRHTVLDKNLTRAAARRGDTADKLIELMLSI